MYIYYEEDEGTNIDDFAWAEFLWVCRIIVSMYDRYIIYAKVLLMVD